MPQFAHRRGQQFSGSPESPDVISDGLPVQWEVKRTETAAIYPWLDQVIADCGEDQHPIVAHRRNGKPWAIVTTPETLFHLLNIAYPAVGLLEHESEFKCSECGKQKPVEDRVRWGFEHVCRKCEGYLFDKAEQRDKRRHG